MTHPDALFMPDGSETGEERAVGRDRDVGAAKLAFLGSLNLAAELGAHGLLAIANPQHRDTAGEDRGIGLRRIVPMGRMRRARQDNRLGRIGVDEGLVGAVIGMDFAEDAALAQTPRDQLGDLAAKVDDEGFFVLIVHALSFPQARAFRGQNVGVMAEFDISMAPDSASQRRWPARNPVYAPGFRKSHRSKIAIKAKKRRNHGRKVARPGTLGELVPRVHDSHMLL